MSQGNENGPSGAERGPYTFTPEKVEAICSRIRKGSFVQHACELERVSTSGLYDAMKRDESIALEIRHAQAESEEQTLATMRCNTFDWKREAWELERKRRDLFKPPTKDIETKNEHTGKDGQPLPPAVTMTIVGTREELLAAAARKVGGG